MKNNRPVLAYVNVLRWPSAIPAGPFTAQYMNAVARAGIETHAIVQSAAKGFNGHNGNGGAVLAEEYGIDPPDNLHFHVVPMPYWRPASDRFFFLEKAGRILKQLQRKSGLNTVMSRDTRVLPYLKRWKKRGLVTLHDTHNFYMDLQRRDDVDPARLAKYNHHENSCLPEIDGLITLLDVQAQHYREFLPGVAIEAHHPGLDEARPPDPSRLNQKTIGYLGSLQKKKGVFQLLEAFDRASLPGDWKLLFVGGRDDNEINPLKKRSEELGISSQVEITGWLSVPEMRKQLNRFTIAILPLEDKFYNRYLTAPSKLFDYLAHSIPTITSDLPAIRELAGNCLFYEEKMDADSLASHINKLVENPEEFNRRATLVHERAKELSWTRRGEQTAEFIQKLLGY